MAEEPAKQKVDPYHDRLVSIDRALAAVPAEERDGLQNVLDAGAVLRAQSVVRLAGMLEIECQVAQARLDCLNALGVVVDPPTRLMLRRRLFNDRPEAWKELCARAVPDSGSSPSDKIDAVYHSLGAEPEKAATRLEEITREWSALANPRDFNELGLALGDYRDGPWLEGAGCAEVLCCIAQALISQGKTTDIGDLAKEALSVAPAETSGKARAHRLLGDYRRAQEEADVAQSEFAECLRISTVLATADFPGRRLDLAIAYCRMGDVFVDKGMTEEALAQYKTYREICGWLRDFAKGSNTWLPELANAHATVGTTLGKLGDWQTSQDEYEKCRCLIVRLKWGDPNNPKWTHELASICSLLGDFYGDLGNWDAALTEFQSYSEHSSALVKQDPSNGLWRRSEALGFGQVSRAQRMLGQMVAAQDSMKKGFELLKQLKEEDPKSADRIHDLAWAYYQLGSIQAQWGKRDDALVAFGQHLEISRQQAARDPGQTQWRRRIAKSLVRRAALLKEQQKLDEALSALDENLGITVDLARNDASNPDACLDLAAAHVLRGTVLRLKRDFRAAESSARNGIAILTDQLKRQPGSLILLRETGAAHSVLGEISEDTAKLGEALNHFRQELAIVLDLVEAEPFDHSLKGDLAASHVSLSRILTRLCISSLGNAYRVRAKVMLESLSGRHPGRPRWEEKLRLIEAPVPKAELQGEPVWVDVLLCFQGPGQKLFEREFIESWRNEPWRPTDDDRKSAGRLHTQLVSRIATQPLGYLDGVEKAALEHVQELFEITCDIGKDFPLSRHFDALAWHVLNTRVRPFTTKWSPRSTRDGFSALDTTDEFRADFMELQRLLPRFAELLSFVRDGVPGKSGLETPITSREEAVAQEMEQRLPWGIHSTLGALHTDQAEKINRAESKAIHSRRQHYGITEKNHATGLALSGGGIRSATFSLGVLVALARRGVLPQFDYLSTVSGGGYLGSFISAYMRSPGNGSIGLRRYELPFQREQGEAAALRHLRHHSKFLATGKRSERLQMLAGQIFGMALNGLAVGLLLTVAVLAERFVRTVPMPEQTYSVLQRIALGAVVGGAFLASLSMRYIPALRRHADRLIAYPLLTFATLLLWKGLGGVHSWFGGIWSQEQSMCRGSTEAIVAGAILVAVLVSIGVSSRLQKRLSPFLGLLFAIAAPCILLGGYVLLYQWSARWVAGGDVVVFAGISLRNWQLLVVLMVFAFALYLLLVDINFTSPHRHYRQKLAEAYLIQPAAEPKEGRPFDEAVSVKLSQLDVDPAGTFPTRGPYHLINCALNVPGTANPAMQGRLTDFFLFSPAFCGSPLIGYTPTTRWENVDRNLDLGTAMAISGAAAAPQMGLGTLRRARFWLALLNVRLGYWVRNPNLNARRFGGAPGIRFLLQEMTGTMHERQPWLHVSDGGHIENLGVYELLRRRCKYIVAVDGEHDPKMTFAALTTLQRLAHIDLGVRIDADLDDLRLGQSGLCRSHFRFCRIHYPRESHDGEGLIGYLLYVKLSLTGNEGEFLRRYRLDEPVFPHHSTADQFFSEAQFEAYRSLGEHIGDKLFIQTLTGEAGMGNAVNLEEWFKQLGVNLLEPLRTGVRSNLARGTKG